jgi:hypothetical protein
VKSRSIAVLVGLAALAGAGLFIAHHLRTTPATDQGLAANANGVVNPDSPRAGLSTEALPQLSEQKFKLPPSMGTGSYTEPVTKKDATKKNSGD